MFETLSDEEIIELIRQGNNDALDYLMKKYIGMVKRECRTLYIIGAEDEDLIQEGMIGLFKAIRDYRPDGEAGFSTFAVICVKRQLITAIKNSNRKKHIPLNTYVSYYAPVNEDDEADCIVENIMADQRSEPEDIMISKEGVASIEEFIEQKLSSMERRILKEFLTGDSYEQISGRLGYSEKSIDNAIQRIRRKLKEHQTADK